MRVGTFASIVVTITLLGCSGPEAPQPAAPAPATAPVKKAERPPRADTAGSAKAPRNPLPTIVMPTNSAPDPRRPVTPCDRNEPGWKWVGTVVEDGKCAVGPCDCVQG